MWASSTDSVKCSRSATEKLMTMPEICYQLNLTFFLNKSSLTSKTAAKSKDLGVTWICGRLPPPSPLSLSYAVCTHFGFYIAPHRLIAFDVNYACLSYFSSAPCTTTFISFHLHANIGSIHSESPPQIDARHLLPQLHLKSCSVYNISIRKKNVWPQ